MAPVAPAISGALRPERPPPPGIPLAFVEKIGGAMRLVALDSQAAELGLEPGLTLADARARVPDLAALTHDPMADQLWLERLCDGCARYTPMAMLDPVDGLTLDITGCAHLFGGEAALAEDAEARLRRLGMTVRHAIASTADAAQALARYQTLPGADEPAAIRRLPVAALRLDSDTITALRRAGLKTVGDVARQPSASIAARFGDEAVAALRRLTAERDSPMASRRPEPSLSCERRFAEPIARNEQAFAILTEMAREAAEALEERKRGGRQFAVTFFRTDGLTRGVRVETSLPTRDPKAIMRLFRERLDSLADPVDPGFGFDLIRLSVPRMETLAAAQLRLEGGESGEQKVTDLIDRLSTRLGRGRLRRLEPCDTHVPEQAQLALPAIDAAQPALWEDAPEGEPPARPIHLFDPPQPIEVLAEVPDGPPHRFRWRRLLHEVKRFEGPERIAPQWWRQERARALTRDYYRVEDARGRRFWIFRHGLYGEEKDNPDWYLHGLFA